jgi:excisionase family DNA binding protein
MPAETIPIPAAAPGQAPEGAAPSPADKLLIDVAELAYLTGLSVRTLRRLDSSRDIPGRVAVGRRVLFQTEAIREWVRAGLPCRDQWPAQLRRKGRS